MRQYCNLVFLILFVFSFWVSCQKKDAQKGTSDAFHKPMQTVKLSNALNAVVDSFIVEMKPYKRIMNMIGYIRFIEVKDNNTFKIALVGIENDTIFKHLTVNDYFIKDSLIFCLDYNISNAVTVLGAVDLKQIIKKSGISKNTAPMDVRKPSWLVQITKDTLEKINRNAPNPFGLKCGDCLEWGGYIDEQGIIHQ